MNRTNFSIKSPFRKTGLISTLAILFSVVVFAQTERRVEPLHWWVGMNDTELELMIHFQGAADAEFSIVSDQVTLASQTAGDSPNYKFLLLDLRNLKNAEECSIRAKIKGGPNLSWKYEFKSRESGSADRQGFNSSDVIYLITPDRFANGDKGNDTSSDMLEGIDLDHLGGRHGGDIKGIIDYIPYLDDMGFTSIWSSPLLENNMEKYSYHGYSITDLYRVDPRFGTLDDYRLLSDLLHKRDMKLIMDIIPNHIGSNHWWMDDLPFNDWINSGGEFSPTNHSRSTLHDLYAAKSDADAFVDGWFVKTMPDLNQRNPHMSKYLIQNAIWWIEEANLDGLRVDTYSYSDKAFLSTWSCAIMNEYPNFNLMGEEWTLNPDYAAYWQKGSERNPTSCLPTVMDFPNQANLIKALTEKETWSDGWPKLYQGMANDYVYPDPMNLLVFPDNHDMDRFFKQVNYDLDLFKLGMTFFLTTRGIPQIYYGTEILLANTKDGDHGDIRMHFPGTWNAEDADPITQKGLTQEQIEAQNYVKRLLNYRKGNELIADGKYMHFSPKDSVYTYFRYNDEKALMIILNKRESDSTLDLSRFEEILSNYGKGRDALKEDIVDLEKPLTLKAKSATLVELR